NNGNGTQGTRENGLPNVTVQLYANGTCTGTPTTTTTDSTGSYIFSGLVAGTTYCVNTLTTTLPAGGTWAETGESDGSINNQIVVAAVSGVASGSNDFGFQRSISATIGDTLYYD